MGLKTGVPYLNLQGQISLETKTSKGHLNILDYSKTCDLDLQGEIGLQTWKKFVLTFKLTCL